MNNQELMDYLIHLRKEKNITQQNIADATGILRPNIVRIEKNRQNASIEVLMKYAKALGYKIDFQLIDNKINRNCPKIGIGFQDFEEVIEGNLFYVDKSLFIKEWWDNSDRITLITRPRRFGKTLNLSMVDRFFSIEYKDEKNYFDKLRITYVDAGKYRELQNSYPVIFISFAGVKAGTFTSALEHIKYEIEDAASLVKVDDIGDLSVSIKNICKSLYKKYGKKVIVLLDEYDTPMQEAWGSGYYEDMAKFIRDLFNNTFKTNRYLYRAILTGITRISQESLFSDLNNICYAGVTDEYYASSFGFTYDEVAEALQVRGLDSFIDEVKYWYDGFNIGKTRDIYNPWSITNYLKNGSFKAYWVNTSSNKLISELILKSHDNIKSQFESLLQGGTIKCRYDESISFGDFYKDANSLWSLLIAIGYLKVNSIDSRECVVSITNYETLEMFKSLVANWFAKSTKEYNEFIKSLLAYNIENMNSYLSSLLINIASYFDVNESAENFYHGLTLGLLVELEDEYELKSNRESGFGRYDVMLIPKNINNNNAYILEFKLFNAKVDKSIDATVDKALEQIDKKKYAFELINMGIEANRIVKIGIAFKGKTVLVK